MRELGAGAHLFSKKKSKDFFGRILLSKKYFIEPKEEVGLLSYFFH